MIYFYLIVGAILIGLSEVLRYHLEPQAGSERLRKRINTAWHIYRDLGIVSYMLLAWQLPQDLFLLVMWLPILWSIHWILTDGVQNLLKGRDFFYISPTSGNYVEKFGKWYIKIALILVGIGIKNFVKKG
jgi:hypothetical protein